MDNAVVVVVGATGAMGQVITKRLAGSGRRVVAVARSASALRDLAAAVPGVVPCEADIAADSATEAIGATLRDVGGVVRMVVQGAGVATSGGVLTTDTASLVDAVNIKVGGMLRLVRAASERLATGSRLVAIGGHYGFEPAWRMPRWRTWCGS